MRRFQRSSAPWAPRLLNGSRIKRGWLALLVCAVAVCVPVGTASAATFTAACSSGVGDPSSLIAAIDEANGATGASTIQLGAGCTYTLTTVDNYWYGPNGLPPIANTITIDGNGATIARRLAGLTPPFRLFFVGADPLVNQWVTPGAGSLTLDDVTLTGGLAQGGNGSQGGGGGAGMGGAIFSQGTVVIDASTITGNDAQGGSGSTETLVDGGLGAGGGIGSSATGEVGGGFGGPATSFGTDPGTGGLGSSTTAEGGGGAGFRMSENGQNATTTSPGSGGGEDTRLGGSAALTGGLAGSSGDGGGGGFGEGSQPQDHDTGGDGGGFGFGGGISVCNCSDGGGGVGGGGGGAGGGGGFGGGGGQEANGGFGGGGGATMGGSDGVEGFGGGAAAGANSGGGAGLGGAIFTMQGQLTVIDSTFTGNVAAGGPDQVSEHAQGVAGAVFNLNGTFDAVDSTFAGNGGDAWASQIYNIDCDNFYPHDTQTTLRDTIVYGGTGGASDVGSLLVAFDVPFSSANADVSQFDLVGTMSAQSSGAITGTPLTSNPDLGPLQNNGGPTQTMALGKTSPAIDAGDPGCLDLAGDPVRTDQRGVTRPQGSACDIGAYEVAPPSITGAQASPTGQTSGALAATINPNEQDTTISVHYGTTTNYGSTVTPQDIGAGNAPVTFTADLPNLQPGTTYHAQITAANADGPSTSADLTFTTAPPPKAPSLTRLTESAQRWREGPARPAISSRRPPVGTTFSFVLDQAAEVTFAFSGSLAGRRVGPRCVAQSHRNRRRPACRRKAAGGSISFRGHPGTNEVRFDGRISSVRALASGNYKLTATATAPTGLRSVPRTLSFTILLG